MKVYTDIYDGYSDEYSDLIVGTTDEIKAVYRSLKKASDKDAYRGYNGMHYDLQSLRKNSIYGISVEEDRRFYIVGPELILRILDIA